MIIREKISTLKEFAIQEQDVDVLLLQWHECRKRIMTKQTVSGHELSLQFLDANPELTEGDILYADESIVIAVEILPCQCLVVHPAGILATAAACYEIGNQHAPLFYEGGQLLIPYEKPLERILNQQGFVTTREERKLVFPLKTSVTPHSLLDLKGGSSSIERIQIPVT